jgi:hypothetical protein
LITTPVSSSTSRASLLPCLTEHLVATRECKLAMSFTRKSATDHQQAATMGISMTTAVGVLL